jgi:ABC-2 type transport system permease protein
VALGLIVLLVLPAAVLVLVQVFTGDPFWGWTALGAGALLGPLVCWGGIVLGGRWYDRRAPELLQEVAQYR